MRKATLFAKLLLLCGVLLSLEATPAVQAATNVGGVIASNTTWTAANSPYVVTESIIVQENVSLTVEPGVTVQFSEDTILSVDGALVARGTADNPITFTAYGALVAGYWGHIIFNDTSVDAQFDSNGNYAGGSVLQHVTVSYGGGISDSSGAVQVTNAAPLIEQATIEYNAAFGVAVVNTEQFLYFNNNRISNNNGGATIKSTGNLQITNNTITDNDGIGLKIEDSAATIRDNTVSRNTHINSGGGIFVSSQSNVTIINNTITDNATTSRTNAGGIRVNNATVDIQDNIISNNQNSSGGGIFVYSSPSGQINNNRIENNTATYGGGIYASSSNTEELLISNNVINNNEATNYGGGINAISVIVRNNEIYNNSSGSRGGGMEVSRVLARDNEIYDNSAGSQGGGIHATSSEISNNIVVNNRTTGSSATGGGIYADATTLSGNTIAHNASSDSVGGLYGTGSEIARNLIAFNSANVDNVNVALAGESTFFFNTVMGSPNDQSRGISIIEDSTPAINNNNLLLSHGDTLYNHNLFPQTVNGKSNWWGTTNPVEIRQQIYDFFDEAALSVVDFSDYLTAPSNDAPLTPPTGLAISTTSTEFKLSWAANPEADIAGYKLFYDTDGQYPHDGTGATQGPAGIDVGNVTNYTLSGLPANQNIYFTLTAYDTEGNESWYGAGRVAILGSSQATPTPLPIATPTPIAEGSVVGGPIASNTTWTAANSPYILVNSVLIEPNVTLTIEPGVTVKLNEGLSILVEGSLVARGTASNPIKLTANGPVSPGYWGYLYFADSAADATFDAAGNYISGSILQHVTVEYGGGSTVSGAIYVDSAAPLIDHCTIQQNDSHGIRVVNNGSPRITNNLITQNDSGYTAGGGLHAESNGAIVLEGNTISRNTGGVSIQNALVTINNNLFTENTDHAALHVTTAKGTISNNQVTDNKSVGISASGSTGNLIVVENNTIKNNDSTGLGGTYAEIKQNSIIDNKRLGLSASGSNVSHNVVLNNGGTNSSSAGIYAIDSTVTYNYIVGNQNPGTTGGIYASSSEIRHNSILFNQDAQGKTAIYWHRGNGEISYNTIFGNTGQADGTGGIYIHDYTNNELTINYNNIYNNQGFELYNNKRTTLEIDAQYNYWGSNSPSQAVFDWFDDNSKGVVDTANHRTEPIADAPPIPPTNMAVTVDDSTFNISWDANPESDIAGYKLFYDFDGSYPYEGSGASEGASGIDVGNVTQYALTGLPANRNIYFTVVAYDGNREESWYAPAVVQAIGGVLPTPTPTSTAPTPTPTATPSATASPTATPSPTGVPTNSTPTATPTTMPATPTSTPMATPTSLPTTQISPEEGGEMTAYYEASPNEFSPMVQLSFPAAAVDKPTFVELRLLDTGLPADKPLPPGLAWIPPRAFWVTVWDDFSGPRFEFSEPFTLTMDYRFQDSPLVKQKEQLDIYYWHAEQGWQKAYQPDDACSECTWAHDQDENRFVLTLTQLGQAPRARQGDNDGTYFAILTEVQTIYLPVMRK